MKRRKQILSILMTVFMVVMMLPTGMVTTWAEGGNPGVSGIESDLYHIRKYTDLKTTVDDFSGNVGIMLSILMNIEGHDTEVAKNLNQVKSRLDVLSDNLEDVTGAVSDYYSGKADDLSFSIDENEVDLKVLKLADEMGDRSAAERNITVIAADCNASISDSRNSFENINIKSAERALLEYADAVETFGKNFEAIGLTTAYSEINQYDEKYKDPSLYQRYNESQISSASESFSKICFYYEWLLDYYKLTDYRNYLTDHWSGTSEEKAVLQKIDLYTFEDVKEAYKVVNEELLPYYKLLPNTYYQNSAIASGNSDPDGSAQTTGSASNVKTSKYTELQSTVGDLSINVDTMLNTIDNSLNPEDLEKLNQIKNRLNSLSDNINDVAEAVSDYYLGKADDLPFSIDEDEVASIVLSLATYTGDPVDSAKNIYAKTWIDASNELGFNNIMEWETGLEFDCNNARELAQDAIDKNNVKMVMQALFEYADGVEKTADFFKAAGIENCFDEINNYEKNYKNSSEYPDLDKSQVSSATKAFFTICCYYEWLLDYYKLVDYGNYLSDHSSVDNTEIGTLQKIDLYTFGLFQKTGEFCIEELLSHFIPFGDNSQYDGLGVVASDPVAADLVYNGTEQVLLKYPGKAEGGTLLYAVSKSADKKPEDNKFSIKIPSKKYPGTYYVWFKVKGDIEHIDSAKKWITVNIENTSDTDTIKAINYLNDVVAANLEIGCNTEKAAKVWFGHHVDVDDVSTPYSWYVIGYDGEEVASESGTATLLAGGAMSTTPFGSDTYYKDSEIYGKIEDFANNLTNQEEKAVKKKMISDINGDPVENALMWPLSIDEAKNVDGKLRIVDQDSSHWNSAESYWWLRSPIKDYPSYIVYVNGSGGVGGFPVEACIGVRPAFNLNLDSVLFTSAAEGGKTGDGALEPVTDYTGNDWKLTLLDSSREFTVTEKSVTGNPGSKVKLNYKNATVGNETTPNEYISAMLVDENDSPLYYGRLSQPDKADGEVSIKLPDELEYGEYTLKLFSEQYNGDFMTDYASNFSDVELTIKASVQDCPRDDSCPITPFTDSNKNAWYHDGVHWALQKAIMYGTDKTTFEPMTPTTRAMLVTMLWRMEGAPIVDYQMSFKDVYKGQWYTEAIRWAASTGIVTGYNEETFGTNKNVTREQLATILYRSAQAKGKGFHGAWAFPLDYEDSDQISGWANEAMHWMVVNGVINGLNDKELSPKSDATRAQVATMLMRFSEKEKKITPGI